MYGTSKKRGASSPSNQPHPSLPSAPPTHPATRRRVRNPTRAHAELNAALDRDELVREPETLAHDKAAQLRWSAPGSWRQALLLQQSAQAALHREKRRQMTLHGGKQRRPMRRLQEICAQTLAVHTADLSPEVLGMLAIGQARLVWQAMQALLPGNLQVWMLFVCAFPTELSALEACLAEDDVVVPVTSAGAGEREQTEAKHLIMARKTHASRAELPYCLAFLAQPLPATTSAEAPWQVLLDVSFIALEADMAVELGAITQLAVLVAHDAGIQEATVRHWCRAQSVGRFAALQVLHLGGLTLPLSVVTALCAFPKLRWIICHIAPPGMLQSEKDMLSACYGQKEDWQATMQAMKNRPCLDISVHWGSLPVHKPERLAGTGEGQVIDMDQVRLRFWRAQEQALQHPQARGLGRGQGQPVEKAMQAGVSSVRLKKKMKRGSISASGWQLHDIL